MSGLFMRSDIQGRTAERLPSPSAATSPPVSSSAKASSAPILRRSGFINVHRAALEFFPVQSCNRRFGFGFIRHFDESKTFGNIVISIFDDDNRFD
jgi:hypothetical protein